jgi:hypothetical protein
MVPKVSTEYLCCYSSQPAILDIRSTLVSGRLETLLEGSSDLGNLGKDVGQSAAKADMGEVASQLRRQAINRGRYSVLSAKSPPGQVLETVEDTKVHKTV